MSKTPKISDQDFIAAYYKALKAKQTLTQFAQSIDSDFGATWSRVNYFRKKKNIPLPPLVKGTRTGYKHEKKERPEAPSRVAKRPTAYAPAIPAADFVRIWQVAATIEEVQEKTGMRRGLARARANKIRKLGVPLKQIKLDGSRGKLDVQALIALAESLAPKEEAQP